MAGKRVAELALCLLFGFLAVEQISSAASPCPHGWIPVGSGSTAQCFKFNFAKKNFNASQDWCHRQGGYLATDTSGAVHNWLKQRMVNNNKAAHHPSTFWLGLTDMNKDKWTWIGTNKALGSFKQWQGTPHLTANKQDCVYINTNDRNAKWRATNNCNALRGIFCQRNQNSVRPTTTRRPRITCDSGWTLYNRNGLTTCVKLFTQAKTWADARTTCMGQTGDLVKITNQRFSGWINGLVNHMKSNYWIGLHDRHKEGQYQWLDDDTNAKYTYWAPHQPDNGGGNENCVIILQGQQYHWNDKNCAAQARFICQKAYRQAITTPAPSTTPASRNCGAGWEDDPNTDNCYQIHDDVLSWLDARQQCKQFGGDLASINSIQEQFYLSARTLSFSSNFYWIGANDRATEAGWEWANQYPLAYVNWAPREPNNAHNSDCAAMTARTGKWVDMTCQSRYGYICEKKGRTTSPKPAKTTSPAANKIPSSQMWGCPLGWRGYRGSCYLLLTGATGGLDWMTSKSACAQQQVGAQLATIVDAQENRFILSILPKGGHPTLTWIGLNDQAYEGSFLWADQLPVTFTNWAPKEPNNVHNEDCVAMWSSSGLWLDYSCTNKAKYMLCKMNKSLRPKAEREIVKGCKLGIGFGARCYTYSPSLMTFNQATNYCRSKHGDLATVNDRHTQAFIASQIQPYGANSAYWIGLRQMVKLANNYTWNNWNSVDYTNWDRSHTGNENGTCVAMRASQPYGLWVNQDCNKGWGFICEFPRQGFTTPKPTTTTTTKLLCPPGWMTYGNYCLKQFVRDVNTSLTWNDALSYCQSLDATGTLATIRNKYFSNYVKQHMLKNVAGHFWIGLSDTKIEGGYEWMDGWAFKWANWATGEPNDYGGKEDCVQLDASDMTWNDATCYLTSSFICQIRKGAMVTTPKPVPTPKRTLQCGNLTWAEYNNNCYFFSPDQGDGSSKSWFDAQRTCQDMGGNLASIITDDENAFVTQQIIKGDFKNYWIGLEDLEMTSYKWVDGNPLAYVSWGTDEPNDYLGSERCVEMNNYAFWNDEHCQETRGYICKKRPGDYTTVPTTTPNTKGGCPGGWSSMPGLSKCYFIGGTDPRQRKNYTDAQAGCSQILYHSSLASVHSTLEEEFITTLLANSKIRWPAWMGFNDQRRRNQFVWVDNSKVDYTIWGPNQPDENLKDNRLVARKDCVDMEVGWSNAGKWYDKRCRDKNAFVCETPKSLSFKAVTPGTGSSVGCPSGYQRFRDSCYKYYPDILNWANMNALCNSVNNGTLVSLQDRFEAYFMELLTAPKVTPGTDLQLWIGLHLDPTMSTYVYADTWPVRWTNWDRGQPSRTIASGCVSHTLNGKWQAVDCNMQLSGVCEVNLKPAPTPRVPATAKCPRNWFGWQSYCYYYEQRNLKTWAAARFTCKAMGGVLASIHSNDEAKFVVSRIRNRQDTWIGLARGIQTGYVWSDNSAVNYLFWAQGEPVVPSAGYGTECVVARRQDGSWRTTDCGDEHAYLCKKDLTPGLTTPPPTVALKTIGDGSFSVTPGAPVQPTYGPVVQPTVPYRPPVVNPTYPPYNPQTYQPVVRPTYPAQQPTQYYPPYNPPQKQTAGVGGSGLSEGSVTGIILGVIAIIAIAAVLIFMVRAGKINVPIPIPGSRGPAPSGFDNATYSNDGEVKVGSDA